METKSNYAIKITNILIHTHTYIYIDISTEETNPNCPKVRTNLKMTLLSVSIDIT